MKICLLLFLALPLFALRLVDYKIHDDKKDSVNITLAFDGAYNDDNVVQKRDNEAVWITLNGVSYNKEERINLQSSLITKMLISPAQNKTTIMLEAKSDIEISSKSINDKMGLMIRALPQGAIVSAPLIQEKKPDLQTKTSSFEGFDFTNYIIIVTILFILLFVLWWFSRQTMRKNSFESKEFKIIFQRPLDRHNQFAILEYGLKRYVMIIGNSNVVLDTIELSPQAKEERKLARKSTVKKEEKSFENFFEENKQRLQKLIKG